MKIKLGFRRKKYATDRISIIVGQACLEKFASKNFNIEDFYLENIKEISYDAWYKEESVGFLTIILNKNSKKQILESIEKLNELDFIEKAYKYQYTKLVKPAK